MAENRSVPGLNGDILGQLTTTIDERQSSAGRAGGQPLLLLTAPRAGYGKTHLLGRLAAAANGQVVLVPLAFRLEDEIGISAVAVRGMESMARAEASREGWTKLREACAGVCAALVRRLIENGTLPCANPEQALRVLGGDPVEVFDVNGSARLIGDWVRRFEGQLRKPMTEQAMKRVPVIPAALTVMVPLPAEPKLSSPGRDLASAMSSFTDLTGIEGCAPSTMVAEAARVIDENCFTVS